MNIKAINFTSFLICFSTAVFLYNYECSNDFLCSLKEIGIYLNICGWVFIRCA